MVHDLLNQVRDTVCQNALFSPGDTVFVAVSGGADSVALLHVLLSLKEECRLSEIRVLHVNHQLRKNADRDEQFVRRLCDALSLKLFVLRADVREEAKKHHETLEEAGRRVRYAFFEEEAAKLPNAKIAVAHNADDHAETILFHIIRGCGLAGLCGIPVSRGKIVRPLLECSSQNIRDFCEENGLLYQIDETNNDMYYARNRIRHEILPSMQKINPHANDSLVRLSMIAREEDAFLQCMAEELIDKATIPSGYDRQILLSANSVIIKRALKNIASKVCGTMLRQSQVEALYTALKETGNANLPSRYYAVIGEEHLRFIAPDSQCDGIKVAVALNVPVCFGDLTVCARRLSPKEYAENLKVHKNLFNFCVSYDMIKKGLFIRSRQTGDTMRPALRGCTKSLKKLYQEWNIASDMRQCIPVICDANNAVLAVVGYAVSEEAAVCDSIGDRIYFEIHSKGCVRNVNAR